MFIQTCFVSVPLDAVLEGTPSRYSKAWATAEGEGQPFQWGLSVEGFRRYSSIQQNFQQEVGESFSILPID